MTNSRLYFIIIFTCWALVSCKQTFFNNSGNKIWSTGTLFFNGGKIESGQDAAYYQAAAISFPVEENDAELYIQDPKNGRSHIFIHPFMGRLKTERLSVRSYQLTGKINLPDDGMVLGKQYKC